MIIAVDESPLKMGQHKVRGSGFYLLELKRALLAGFSDNKFIFFTRGQALPKDVNVLHIPYFEPFFLSLPFFNPFNSVVTIHDLTPLVYPDLFPAGIKGKVKFAIQKVLLRRYKAIITDSEASKQDIATILGINKSKIHVVTLAAAAHFRDLQLSVKEKNTVLEKYGLPQKFALYVGDATRNKNLPRIIQAAEIADIPLVMVGKALSADVQDKDNAWNVDLIAVKKAALHNKNIILLGYLSDDDLVKLYNVATFSVLVSLYEGFGLPILEAMQSGCPIIVSKLGSIPEVAGSAGVYVDAFDVHNIAEHMRNFYDDSRLRRKMIERGFLQIKKFSWGKTAAETMKVYEKVAHS